MTVLGLDVAHRPMEIRARIGYMPESDAHIPGMNAVSFVGYCGQLAGLPAVDAMQRAHEVLYYVGLGEARYRNIETYSTGMKQRIKLAQALVHDPDLLFLDEPTNGMDPKGRDEMLELIRDLGHKKNVNLILSSHLLPDVEFTCDDVIVMDKGADRRAGPDRGAEGAGRPRVRAAHQGGPSGVPRSAAGSGHGVHVDRPRRHARIRAGPARADRARERSKGAVRARGEARRAGPPSAAKRSDSRGRVRQSGGGRVSAMPIHDQSYRRYRGRKAMPGQAWAVIARAGMLTMIRKRMFLGLLLFAWSPFVVRAVQIYVTANYPQVAMFAPTAETFRQFLEQQDFFVFIVTIYAGAGLIANDRRANALQIYLSKPLMRSEYIAGKAAILFAFLLFVTFVPAMLLLLLQVMFAGSFEFLKKNLFLFPAITVASLLQAMLATFTMLALSSLSKSSRYVGILYAGIIFFTAAIYGVMLAITGSTKLSWLSLGSNLQQVVDVIFRLKPRYATPWPVSLIVILGLIALAISVLERRVRGVEVVT